MLILILKGFIRITSCSRMCTNHNASYTYGASSINIINLVEVHCTVRKWNIAIFLFFYFFTFGLFSLVLFFSEMGGKEPTPLLTL